MPESSINLVQIADRTPAVESHVQTRVPSVGEEGDGEIKGREFLARVSAKLYLADKKTEIGTVTTIFDSSRKVYYTVSIYDDTPPGKDKILGVVFDSYAEIFIEGFETR